MKTKTNCGIPISGSVGRRQKISGNADFQSAVPQISQLLENLQSTKQHLNQLWVVKKMRLEQCLQLRIFEEDVEKVGQETLHSILSFILLEFCSGGFRILHLFPTRR